MGLTLNVGDIVLVDLGEVGKSIKGHEQAKTRPCLVIKALNALEMAIIVPFTTTRPRHPSMQYARVPGGSGGLNKDSYALCHQIRSISRERIIKSIGTLSPHYLDKVRWVLGDLLGF